MLRNTIYKSALFYLFLFIINGVFGELDEVRSVSVMEGDSVTLHADITDIQRDDQILWMFGPKETRIAEIYRKGTDMFDSNKTFGDHRLLLNHQTGSLTIRNIKTEHSGLYKLQIRSNRGNSEKRFCVTVHGSLPIPVIISNSSSNCSLSSSSSSLSSSSSKCVLLCSVLNVRDVSLSWYKGNSLLSSISVSDLNIRLSLPLEIEYQDTNTYSCVLNNTITNQTQHLNINDVCQTCSEEHLRKAMLKAVIPLAILLIVLAVVMTLYWKGKKEGFEPCEHAVETVQTDEEELHYTDTVFCRKNEREKKANGTKEIIYSRVVTLDTE